MYATHDSGLEYTCKFCKGTGDYSQFGELNSETREGICEYCMDIAFQPDQEQTEVK